MPKKERQRDVDRGGGPSSGNAPPTKRTLSHENNERLLTPMSADHAIWLRKFLRGLRW